MPNGKIGSAKLTALGGWTLLGTLDAAMTVNVRFANDNGFAASVWTAIGLGAPADDGNLVTPGFVVQAHCPYEDTGMSCSAGESIWAKSTSDNVTVRAHGILT